MMEYVNYQKVQYLNLKTRILILSVNVRKASSELLVNTNMPVEIAILKNVQTIKFAINAPLDGKIQIVIK